MAFSRARRWHVHRNAVGSMSRAMLTAFLLLGSVPAAAQYHLDDSLRGGTGGNAIGGSFGPEGWTVTGRADRIWWSLPRLARGSIEFTVSNVTMASLDTADHEIFAMYEAGYGMVEPIPYNPDFRNNHYKCMIRVYGAPEGDRAGQQKLMWGMCPSGDPGRDECGCGSFFEEPFGGTAGWDGSPQRFRVEWGDGTTRLLRNGAEVVSIDWSESGIAFGPSELHFSLGTPRPLEVDTASMPIGAVFSDVVVDGVEGPLSTCGGPGDAGPTSGEDAGRAGDGGGAISDGGAMRPDAGRDPTSADSGREPTDRPMAASGGCDCAIAAGPSGAPFVVVLVTLLAAHLRRRSRRGS
jgi:MYXO-CTERM domain-containing protein